MPGDDLSDAGPLPQTILHASCVAAHGKAVLILGASGAGKSALSLDLMSRGAELVSDDRTQLTLRADRLEADAVNTIAGFIEARGVGILKATPTGPMPLALVVDLDKEETARLPNHYTFTRFGVTVPLLYRVLYPHFAPAILQFLKAGRGQL